MRFVGVDVGLNYFHYIVTELPEWPVGGQLWSDVSGVRGWPRLDMFQWIVDQHNTIFTIIISPVKIFSA